MRNKTEKAVASTTASKKDQQHEFYSASMDMSTGLLELSVNLLLGMQAPTLTVRQSEHDWQLFEFVLHQHYGLKTCRGQQ